MAVDEERFHNEVNKLYKQINELNTNMERTNEKIRNYNGLRDDLQWAIGEIKTLKATKQSTSRVLDSSREWLLLVVSTGSVLIALASVLYNIFGGA